MAKGGGLMMTGAIYTSIAMRKRHVTQWATQSPPNHSLQRMAATPL
jgi:hypothetical protein